MHLGLIGYGNIATSLIGMLDTSHVTGVSVLVRPGSSKTVAPSATDLPVRVVADLEGFRATRPDLIVECAGHAAVGEHVPPLLAAGYDVVLASIGALADASLHEKINSAAEAGGSRLILPSGAIGGLDMLRTLSCASAVDVTYTGTKPPRAWAGSPAEDLADLEALEQAETFFRGTGREAALTFPKNANVVAALALAGAGFDEMQVALVADPQASANQHAYTVTSPNCTYAMTIDATASTDNARTSQTTVFSILQEILAYRVIA